MIVQLHIPDELAGKYQTQAKAANRQLEEALVAQLQRFSEIRLTDRIVVLMPELREAIEKATNGLPLHKAEDLLERIRDLASVQIGRILFTWTPAQFRQLAERAARWNTTPESYAETVVRQIEAQFFDEMPRAGEILEPKRKAG